jgi:hypothetical protein
MGLNSCFRRGLFACAGGWWFGFLPPALGFIFFDPHAGLGLLRFRFPSTIASACLMLLALLASFCCHRYRGFSFGLYFLFSLTLVRGGTCFFWLAPKEARKGASPHNRLSVALEGLPVCGATLFMLRQFVRVFEHHGLFLASPPRFATSAPVRQCASAPVPFVMPPAFTPLFGFACLCLFVTVVLRMPWPGGTVSSTAFPLG